MSLAVALMASLLLSSCGSSGGGADVGEVASSASAAAKPKTLEDFQFKKGTDVVYGEKGTPEEGMIVGGRRSQYEGKRQNVFGGEFNSKQFQTDNYKAGAWDGTKDFGRKSYTGNTQAGDQYQMMSELSGQANRNSQRSSGDGQVAYGTNRYATSSAREGGAAAVSRDRSYYDDDVYPMPKIYSKRDYQKMTIQETNSLLGR